MPVQPRPESPPEWTFLSNHGHVLVCLALDPRARLRDIAARVGITERGVQGILRNLEDAGYVLTERVGRRNSYTVKGDQPFRHPLEARVPVGDFLRLIVNRPGGTEEVLGRGWGAGDPDRGLPTSGPSHEQGGASQSQ